MKLTQSAGKRAQTSHDWIMVQLGKFVFLIKRGSGANSLRQSRVVMNDNEFRYSRENRSGVCFVVL